MEMPRTRPQQDCRICGENERKGIIIGTLLLLDCVMCLIESHRHTPEHAP